MKTIPLDIDRLRQAFHYDPDTGALIRKNGGRAFRFTASFDGNQYSVIRLAYGMANNVDPVDGQGRSLVVALDGDRTNLRRSNLAVNTARQVQIRNHNNAKYPGVSWHKKSQKWRARIGLFGKRIWLGEYVDRTRAVRAVEAAREQDFDWRLIQASREWEALP